MGTTGSMTAYFERHVARLEAAGQYWQHKHFAVTINHVRAALGVDVLWAEVDRDAIGRFERYLRVEQKNQPNTVRNHLKRLRRVYHEALREGIIQPNDNPFTFYTSPKAGVNPLRRLSRTLCDHVAHRTRLRSSSKPARPYIWRLSIFKIREWLGERLPWTSLARAAKPSDSQPRTDGTVADG